VHCYLINTGWTAGGYGVGHRISLGVTRTLVKAALSGEVDGAEMRQDKNFGFAVPISLAGVEKNQLDPRKTWANPEAYDSAAAKLSGLFEENFKQFEPQQRLAAE
jgi:phosphoenolpyruvate carboxykinase (ATP)